MTTPGRAISVAALDVFSARAIILSEGHAELLGERMT